MIYTLQCLSGSEMDVRTHLQRIGYKTLMPREQTPIRRRGKWIVELRILIPGYVFIDLPEQIRVWQYTEIRRQTGVIQFLGKPMPEALPPEEESWVQWIANEDNPLDVSSMEVGKQVTVLRGPLLGHEGEIIRIDARRHRCIIKVITLGITHEVSLAVDVIKTLD